MENNTPNEGQSNTTITIQIPGSVKIPKNRSIVTSTFALAVLCFFLTFCDFRCTAGRKVASIKGIELVTGKKMKVETFEGGKTREKEIPPNIFAILALAAGIVGFAVYSVNAKGQNKIGTVSGAAGSLLLLMLYYTLTKETDETSKGTIEVKYQIGFWCSLMFFGMSSLLSYLRTKQEETPVVGTELDVVGWAKINQKKLVILIVVLVAASVMYYIFLSDNPRRDAKRAISGYCDCLNTKTDQLIKDEKAFLDTANFNNETINDNEITWFYQKVKTAEVECQSASTFDKYKGRYASSEENSREYERIYDSIYASFRVDIQNKLNIVNAYAHEKYAAFVKRQTPNVPVSTTNDQQPTSNENEQRWKEALSKEFSQYQEQDDVPGQTERYKDSEGRTLTIIAWGRNITSDDPDSAVAEGISMVFDGYKQPTKTSDGMYISTGTNTTGRMYYIIYSPKQMQSYSLTGSKSDENFSGYSLKLLREVRR